MKAACSASVEIALPVEPVYRFVADVARWPLWLSFVVSASAREAPLSAVELEQEIDICMQRGRRRWREAFDVIRLVPNAFVWLEGCVSAARRIEFRFEQRRAATRVHCTIGYPVFGGFLGRARNALFMRRAVARELRESMRQLQETLAPPSLDGAAELAGPRGPSIEERAGANANQAILT